MSLKRSESIAEVNKAARYLNYKTNDCKEAERLARYVNWAANRLRVEGERINELENALKEIKFNTFHNRCEACRRIDNILSKVSGSSK